MKGVKCGGVNVIRARSCVSQVLMYAGMKFGWGYREVVSKG